MRLIAGCARAGKWNSVDDFSVIRRPFIKVHYGQEVGIRARLIAGPDKEKSVPLVIALLFLLFLLSSIGLLRGAPNAFADAHHAQTKQRRYKDERCRFQKMALAGSY